MPRGCDPSPDAAIPVVAALSSAAPVTSDHCSSALCTRWVPLLQIEWEGPFLGDVHRQVLVGLGTCQSWSSVSSGPSPSSHKTNALTMIPGAPVASPCGPFQLLAEKRNWQVIISSCPRTAIKGCTLSGNRTDRFPPNSALSESMN